MKFKKILATVAAAAVAVSALAFSAFAETVTLDSEYVGDWGSGATITKEALQAIGGDVKVVLTIETYDPFGLADQFLLAPMDYDNSWTRITDQLTSDTLVAKTDGFIGINKNQTTVEFVVPAATIDSLGDSGIGFQVQKVLIKSADLSAGSAQGAIKTLEEDQVKDYCFADDVASNGVQGAAADAATDTTPDAAADAGTTETTTPAATGNTSAAVIVSVMALAGVAAVAAKKRK